jgi:hypothetical protein
MAGTWRAEKHFLRLRCSVVLGNSTQQQLAHTTAIDSGVQVRV